MINNQEMLKKNYNELVELRYVLEKDNFFFKSDNASTAEEPSEDEVPLIGEEAAIAMTYRRAIKLG